MTIQAERDYEKTSEAMHDANNALRHLHGLRDSGALTDRERFQIKGMCPFLLKLYQDLEVRRQALEKQCSWYKAEADHE